MKQESAKLVSELQRQKQLLELQVNLFFFSYNISLCFFFGDNDLHRLNIMNQLQESKAKIQNLENRQEGVSTIFQQERARRDVTEDGLRKKLRVSPIVITI